MKYYQEIRLLADAEASLGFLWQKIYQQIHLALAENKVGEHESAIGLSFPGYYVPKEKGKKQQGKGFPLGDKIRLFANSKEELEKLELEDKSKAGEIHGIDKVNREFEASEN